MKTRELIELLRERDPGGELEAAFHLYASIPPHEAGAQLVVATCRGVLIPRPKSATYDFKPNRDPQAASESRGIACVLLT